MSCKFVTFIIRGPNLCRHKEGLRRSFSTLSNNPRRKDSTDRKSCYKFPYKGIDVMKVTLDDLARHKNKESCMNTKS